MIKMSRRNAIRGSMGVVAASALARPYIANAAAKTAEVWWTQGFIPEEDASFRHMVKNYEKASGNKINYSILPFVALEQKMISALQTGHTPDLMEFDGIQTTLLMSAWKDKLVDVSDVVQTQEKDYSKIALLSTKLYNKMEKRRAYYAVPFKCASAPFHIWGDLVKDAGYDLKDIPDTWNKRWDWFKPMQAKLRAKGRRNIYSFAIQMTTNGPSDGNAIFHYFLFANGGQGLVTPDGQIHLDDPKIKQAVVDVVRYFTDAYKHDYTPSGCISWNDADDNNGFHSKLFVMDVDGTLSTELAMIHRPKDYNNCVTMGLPMGNDGKPMPAAIGVIGAFIPKAAKNPEVAKDFMRYAIQPEVNNEYLKAGLGRWCPVFPDMVRNDPFWLHSKDPHRGPYLQETVLGPGVPDYGAYNPAYADVEAQQVWGQTYADVYKNGMTPEKAVDKAFKQIEHIFSRYPMA